MEEILIRKATIDDCDRLMDLTKELAVYSGELDLVQLSAEDLKRDGFGEKPYFGTIVAEINKHGSSGNGDCVKSIIGYALYYNTYSTKVGKCIYINDLYVQQNYRRKGVGKRLFKEMTKIANEDGCYRLRWHVFCWNEGALEFYKRQEARDITFTDSLVSLALDQPDLAKAAMS